jgi:seryl-tRNA synthetase
MLDLHITQHGYTSIWLPLMANEQTMRGCGQLPKFGNQLFTCERDNLYLIPTAETGLAGLHAGEILSIDNLPTSYVASRY